MLDQMVVTFDILIAHFEASKARHVNNKRMLKSITTSWYVLNNWYLSIDKSLVYICAVLCHLAHRKQYLDTAWRRDWITKGLERARALWDDYKHAETASKASTEPAREPQTQEPHFLNNARLTNASGNSRTSLRPL